MTILSSRYLIFEVKSTGSELAFIRVLRLGLGNARAVSAFGRLRTSLEDFELLQKTSDFFGNLRKCSCRLQKSQHSQDKNLTLISQKKLAGIRLLSLLRFVKTIATWKTVIESMQSLGMDKFRVAFTRFLAFYSDNPSGLHEAKHRRNGKVRQVSPLTPRPNPNGRQNF